MELSEVNLSGADLTNAVPPSDLSAFTGARFDSPTQWAGKWQAPAVADDAPSSGGRAGIGFDGDHGSCGSADVD